MNDIEWPTEYDLISFFGTLPVESQPNEGFWCYRTEKGDLSLQVSLDMFERSIQTVLEAHGKIIATVSHEGLDWIKIASVNNKETLSATFEGREYKSRMEIKIEPDIEVKWFSLKE